MAEVTPLTPEGLRSIKFERTFRGYDPNVVDQLLRELATSLEGLIAERAELKKQIQGLEQELAEHRGAQHLMREALVSAQRAADELLERTAKESADILEKARAEAEDLKLQAELDREQAESDIKRLRSQEQELRASYRVLLAAALDRLEGDENGGQGVTSLLDALAPRRVSEASETSEATA
jgi:cell division initiation protein